MKKAEIISRLRTLGYLETAKPTVSQYVNAVEWFQSDNGLNVDGDVGPHTMQALSDPAARPRGSAKAVSTRERFEIRPDELAILLEKTGWLQQGGDIGHALAQYQEWHGLLIDEWAGPKVYRSLEAPRFCAYPDDYSPPQSVGGRINRWGKKNLKIQVSGRLGTLSKEQFGRGVLNGARTWSKVCGVNFDLTESSGDIFVDSGLIDGPGRTLAYMMLPMTDGHLSRLDGRFDQSEAWERIIEAVAAHEFGHALGLGHTNVPRQLMNPMLANIATPQAGWDAPEVVKRYGEPVDVPPPPPPDDDGFSFGGLVFNTPAKGGEMLGIDVKR